MHDRATVTPDCPTKGPDMNRSPRLASFICLSAITLTFAACTPPAGRDLGGKTATDTRISSFVYGLEAIPPTLDVSDNYNSADMAVMGLITQPLEIANLDGTYTPILAEKVSQPDPLTLVYDLRTDVRFSDGALLTAADVVWTIAHLREPTTQTATELTDFATVTATTKHQVTVKLKQPNNAARGSLAIISFIQQKTYGQKQGDKLGTSKAPPIGTGPYVVSSYDTNGVTLTRNDKYAGEQPAADSVKFTHIADDNAAQLAMRSGQLSGLALFDVKTANTWKSVPGATLYSSPTLYLDYVTMNTQVAPFTDIHVRRALAYATDVNGLLAANYGDQGQAARAMTPSQILTRLAPDQKAQDELNAPFQPYAFDLDKAKQELAQSTYPQGFTTEYEFYSPAGKLVGLSLAENLKKIGITVKLISRRLNDFIGDIFVGKVPALGFFSIAAVVPDPSSWYQYLVAKANPYNASRFSTPQTESALRILDTSTDPDQRWKAMQTITQAMATELPYIGLAQPNFVFAAAQGTTFTKEPDFMDVSTGNWIHFLKSTE
jgi:peptide/nickel transport system substrate-binding protein